MSCHGPEAKAARLKPLLKPLQPLEADARVCLLLHCSHPVARSPARFSIAVGMSKNDGGVSTIVSNPDDTDCNDNAVSGKRSRSFHHYWPSILNPPGRFSKSIGI